LSKGPDGVELRLRARYSGAGHEIDPPVTHRFSESARPVISSDAHTVIVDLVDFTGERAVGLYDWRATKWTVIDYAWEPASSPTPAASGPLDEHFVRGVLERFLHSWDYAERRAEHIAGRPVDPSILPMKWLSFKLDKPRRAGKVWNVHGYVWGQTDGRVSFGEYDFEVGSRRGRLTVTPRPRADLAELHSLSDAALAIDTMLDAEVVAPESLPGGQVLDSISAWGGSGYISTKLPKNNGGDGGGTIELSYGDVSFYGGCGGGSGKPRPITVGDQPALFDKIGSVRQVIWPAAPGDKKQARFSVYGNGVSRDELLEVAESIESLR